MDEGYTNKELLRMIYENQLETNEHLTTLNGKVAANVKQISANTQSAKEADKRLNRIDIRLAVFAASITVILTVIQFIVKLYF